MNQLEQFREMFAELSDRDKVNLYRDYQRELDDEEEWYDFDEEFFEVFFSNAMEAVRAWHFGGGGNNSWNDDYIHFNAYGNLETSSEYLVAKESMDYIDEIFEHPDLWEEYITLDEESAEDEE